MAEQQEGGPPAGPVPTQWVGVIINTSRDAMDDRSIESILGPVFGPYATSDEAQAAIKQWMDGRPFTWDIDHASIALTTDVESMVNFLGHPGLGDDDDDDQEEEERP
jgi:hypothetical protein